MKFNTVIIGSGCAGFKAANSLFDLGVTDIAIVTEGINMGTSRNTGSDKQTYYKLTLAGGEPDSVQEMANTLFDGGSMHGDIALAQAACSTRAFMSLVELGLPFPTNRYGAFVGYKTDHDPRQRATSCGPLTSKLMTEALEKEAKRKGIAILDNLQVVKLLTNDNKIQGIAAIEKNGTNYKTITASNVILATGGPAAMYHDSVFPHSQTGSTGLALDAGATATNLQEWQYGLASTDFRWNVSGTYQQVLPRYISVDAEGRTFEFLRDYFDDVGEALSMVFLKGYQWPFDVQKADASSRIDLFVAEENAKGRTVYMDFRENPKDLDFEKLSNEAYTYLEKSGALFGTPIKRLEKMNPKAIQLYMDNGIDLYKEPLKVAVCAQHCNGGISVDANWESSVSGLYVVGEAAGTFGVYRPGGSALNDTQVGAILAAKHISSKESTNESPNFTPPVIKYGGNDWQTAQKEIQKRMSQHAAYVRDTKEMIKLQKELQELSENYFEKVTVASDSDIPALYKFYDMLITQISALSAMIFAAENIGSRGSAFVKNAKIAGTTYNDKVVVTSGCQSHFETVRPMPDCNDWFESVWNKSNSKD